MRVNNLSLFLISLFTLLLGSNAYPNSQTTCKQMANDFHGNLQSLVKLMQNEQTGSTQNQKFAKEIEELTPYTTQDDKKSELREDFMNRCRIANSQTTTTTTTQEQALDTRADNGPIDQVFLILIRIETQAKQDTSIIPIFGSLIGVILSTLISIQKSLAGAAAGLAAGTLAGANPTPGLNDF